MYWFTSFSFNWAVTIYIKCENEHSSVSELSCNCRTVTHTVPNVYSSERKTLTLKLCDCDHGFHSGVPLGSDLPVSVPRFLLVCVFHTNAWLLNPTVGWTLTKPIRLMRENALPDDHSISSTLYQSIHSSTEACVHSLICPHFLTSHPTADSLPP